MIAPYLKYFIRVFSKNVINTVVKTASITIGLIISIVFGIYIKSELSYDRFHAGYEEIHLVVNQIKTAENEKGSLRRSFTAFITGPELKSKVPGITGYCRLKGSDATTTVNGHSFQSQCVSTDSNFFNFFSFNLNQGRANTALANPNSVVLTKEAAFRYFGTVNAIGLELFLKEPQDTLAKKYIVAGISDNPKSNSTLKFDILKQLPETMGLLPENFASERVITFLKYDKQSRKEHIDSRINAVIKRELQNVPGWGQEDLSKIIAYELLNISKIHFDLSLSESAVLSGRHDIKPLYLLALCGIVMLALAAINFVNITLADIIKRYKEIGVRLANGASKKHIFFQFMSETFFICFLSLIISFLIAVLLLPYFSNLIGRQIIFIEEVDLSMWGMLISILLLTTILAGIYPSYKISSVSSLAMIKSREKFGGHNFSKILIILQVSSALILVFSTYVLHSQYEFLKTSDMGYNDKNVLLVNLPSPIRNRDKAISFKSQIDRINAVKNSSLLQVNDVDKLEFAVKGKAFNAYVNQIDHHYFSLLGVTITNGSDFTYKNSGDTVNYAIVNERFVKSANLSDPVGKIVYEGTDPYTIVGVVKDINFLSLKHEIDPILYQQNNTYIWYGLLAIKIDPDRGALNNTITEINKVFKSFYPADYLDSYWLSDFNVQQYRQEDLWRKLILVAAACSLLIGIIGIYGLSCVYSESRLKEIGIRKVLGATQGDILFLIASVFLKLVLLSVFIALPIQLLLSNMYLNNYPYRTSVSIAALLTLSVLVITLVSAVVGGKVWGYTLKKSVDILKDE